MSEENITEAEDVSEPLDGVADEVTEADPSELSEEDLDKLLQEESEPEEKAEAKDSEAETKEEASKEEEKPEDPESAKRIKELEEANSKLQAQLTQQEQFIQRRNGELGQTRAKLTEAIEVLKGRLDEKYLESPSEGIKLQKQIETLEGKVGAIDAEAEAINTTFATQKAVAKFVKPNEVTLDAMVGCLSEDGIDSEYIEEFKKNPFSLGAAATVHLAKRAKAERERDEARSIALQLWEKLQKSEKQPASIVKQINSVAKQKPGVNGGSGKSPAKKSTPSNPALLSDSELDELLKSATE